MKTNEKIKHFKLKDLANYQYIYAILLIIAIKIGLFSYDNDFWFTINQGKYVLENGFPTKAIYSIHNIPFLYQSWGTGTLFYLIYNKLGYIGMILLLAIVGILTSYFFYKLCFVISNKKKLSLKITFLMMLLYTPFFLVTRPHIFTVLNLIIILYLLESYIKTNKKMHLYIIPLLTILEVNMHGIYFLVLLIILLPFIINSFKIKKLNSEGYKKKDLFIVFILMIISGFINPYGYKTIIYGLSSYSSNSLFNNTVSELMTPNFHFIEGKIAIITILLIYIIYFSNKEKVLLRYYLLLFGTTYLALDANKSLYFFLICSLYPLAYILKNNKSILIEKEYSKSHHIIHFVLTCSFILIICLNISKPKLPESNNMINYLDRVVQDKTKVKLYTNYVDGSYAEYRGYYCYMDPRGEIFLEKVNHQKDIYKEYMDITNININYQEFLDKYQLDYLLLNKNDILYKLMSTYKYNNYEVIKEDDNYQLLSLKEFLYN
jgi:hypothetical protein